MPDVLLSTRLSPSPTPPLTRPPLVPQAAQISTLHRERKQSLETICELRARMITSQQAQLSLQRRVIELEKQLPDDARRIIGDGGALVGAGATVAAASKEKAWTTSSIANAAR